MFLRFLHTANVQSYFASKQSLFVLHLHQKSFLNEIVLADCSNMLLTRSAPWYIVWQSSSTYASLGPKPIVYGPWTVSALCLERFRCFVYYLPTISRTLYCRLGTQQLQHQSKLSSWYFHWSVKDLVSSMLVSKLSSPYIAHNHFVYSTNPVRLIT